MLVNSREIRARLAPKPVARKTTLDYLSKPRNPHGDPDMAYNTYGPIQWAVWKQAELEAKREAEEERRRDNDMWMKGQEEVLEGYEEEKERRRQFEEAKKKAEQMSEKRYGSDLHKFLAAKAPDELAEYAEERRQQLKRAQELHTERVGGFAISADLTVR